MALLASRWFAINRLVILNHFAFAASPLNIALH